MLPFQVNGNLCDNLSLPAPYPNSANDSFMTVCKIVWMASSE